MKIDGISKVYGLYESKAINNRQFTPTKASAGFDRLSLSSDAKDFQAVMKGLKESPDIREDRVQEVAKKYESANYFPDYREVAEGMLNSGIFRNSASLQK